VNAPLPRPLAADGIVNIDARGLAQYLWSESNREQIERGGYYGSAPTELKAVNQKLRKAIEDIGSLSRIEGLWWQFSVTERSTWSLPR
jgi:hypothetical protein